MGLSATGDQSWSLRGGEAELPPRADSPGSCSAQQDYKNPDLSYNIQRTTVQGDTAQVTHKARAEQGPQSTHLRGGRWHRKEVQNSPREGLGTCYKTSTGNLASCI